MKVFNGYEKATDIVRLSSCGIAAIGENQPGTGFGLVKPVRSTVAGVGPGRRDLPDFPAAILCERRF